MNLFKKSWLTRSAQLAFIVMIAFSIVGAQMDPEEIREQRKEGIEEVADANKVFREIMSKPDQGIPKYLLENATAIGIFPNVLKAAFVFGGRGGDGIVVRRTASGEWANPVFYNLGGGSFGAQIGAKSTDHIMLFMNEGALLDLADDKLEFGGDASFAAGPVGRTAGASTNLTLDAGILTWSRSEGAFIGASLKGAVIDADNSINQAFYGKDAKAVLQDPSTPMKGAKPAEFQALTEILTHHGGTSTKNPTKAAAMKKGNGNAVYMNSNMNRFASFDTASGPSGNMRVDPNVQDLARRVRSELLTLPYYSVFDWIEFIVSPTGVVTLSGSVTAPPDTKSRAEAYVEDVKGVSGVVNNIEILPVSPNDDRLRRALYREVYSGPLYRYQVGSLQNIHIVVKNGHATLEGVVDNESDRNLAGIRAKTVPAVFSVTNNLAVNKEDAE